MLSWQGVVRVKRSLEEKILLALCLAGALGIIPFALYRFSQGDWIIGVIDSLIVMMVVAIGYHVWSSGKVRVASIILTFSYMTGMVAVNYVSDLSLIFWAYPTMAAAYFLIRPKEALAVCTLSIIVLIPSIVDRYIAVETAIILITLFLTNIFAYIFACNNSLYQQILTFQAKTDALTGAANRVSFEHDTQKAIYLYRRYAQTFSLIMIDIDLFKKVNDTYGHQVGDEVLAGFVQCCKSRLRQVDSLYRIGGEEFVVLAKGTPLHGAMQLADELRELVQKTKLLPDGKPVTISLGVAEYRDSEAMKSFVKRADCALYRAKQSGRNQVCSEQQVPESCAVGWSEQQ